jgi:hypothetical protein
MISWLWLLVAVWAGAFLGWLGCALAVMAKQSDSDYNERNQ